MKKIQTGLKGFILFVLAASSLFVTCEIGLGDSVDTKPPTVSVLYPPAVSVIRGDFVVAGSAADETSLATVLVSMTATSGSDAGLTFGPWSATIDRAANAWRATVPAPASDGTYTVTAEAVDNANRKTTTSVSYIIDNTAPVLVVQRPSTMGNLLVAGDADNVDAFDPYGSDLSFTGNMWDSNQISLMTIRFYDRDGNPIGGAFTNTPPTQSFDVAVTGSVLDELKADVAAHANKPQPYWYTIDVADNALPYVNPDEASLTANKTGNATAHYYTYVELAALVGATESYPKLTNLSAFENDASAVSGIPVAMRAPGALDAIRISCDPADFAIDENGNFSFDPLNADPTISIAALEVSAPVPTASDNRLSPLPSLDIRVEPNKDGVVIDKTSIVVTLTPFADDGVTLTTPVETWTSGDLSMVTLGTILSINYQVKKSYGLYQLTVSATDVQGHSVTDKYGFNINTGAPTLSSLNPDKTGVTKVNSYTGGDGLQKFKVVVTGTDGDAGVTLVIQDGGADAADAVITKTSDTVASGIHSYQWEAILNAPAEGSTRVLRFWLDDSVYTSTAREITFQTDNTVPELALPLTKPALKDSPHVAAGKAVVTDTLITVRGFADADLDAAILRFTDSATPPSAATTTGWTTAEVDNNVTGATRGFTASVSLPVDAASGEVLEGSYWLWVRLADDTFDATLENYGPVTGALEAIYDKNAPELSETAVNTTDRVYRNAPFVLSGYATDTNGVQSLVVSETVPGSGSAVAHTVSVDADGPDNVPGTADDGFWSYAQASSANGLYRYSVNLTDIAGSTASLVREVYLDTVLPVVTISPIGSGGSGAITTSTYDFKGSVTESGSGISGAEVSFDGGSTWLSTEGTSTWYYSYDFGSADETDVRTIRVRATDNAGNLSAVASANYTIDLADPRAVISTPAAGTQGNADIVFSGTADDASVTPLRAASSATLSWSKDGAAATDVVLSPDLDGADNTAGTADDGAWSWTLEADPNSNGDHSADGLYNITLTVTDQAGKIKTASRSVQIDTTGPSLIIDYPAANEATALQNYTISGTARDTGGVGFDGTLDAEYSFNGTDWTAMGSLVATNSWSATPGLGSVEGTMNLQVRATDKLGNRTSKSVTFYYDLANPSLDETGINTTATQYRNGDFTLSGNAADSNQLASVIVTATKNGAAQGVVFIKLSAGAWSWTKSVDVSGHTDDAEWVYTITAKDVANKTSVLSRTVVVDTTDPVATVNAMPGYLSGTVTIGGTGTDTNIDRVEYQLGGTAGAWTTATGTNPWTHSLSLASSAEGNQTLYARAYDKAGNVSAYASTALAVDRANPRAAVSNPPTAALLQRNTDVVLAGTADDALVTAGRAAASATLSVSKDGVAGADVPLSVDLDGADNILGNADDGSWSWTLDSDPNSNGDHSADGLYAITLTVTDIAGKTATVTRSIQIDTTAPTLVIDAPAPNEATALASYTIKGTARDTGGVGFDGTLDAEYNMNGAGWVSLNSLVSTINWSAADVSLGASEGTKSLQIRATDKLGNQALSSVSFYYDLALPELYETGVNTTDTQYLNGGTIVFSGTALDSNALSGLAVSVDGGASQAIAVDGGTHGWSWTFDSAARSDGTYSVVFTATDAANKLRSVARTVCVDKSAPTVSSITNIGGSWKTSASHAIAGAASDGAGSGLARVEYRVSNDGGSSVWSSWSSFTGTTSFSGTATFEDGNDNILQIRAVDKAGNTSIPVAGNYSEQTVWVDTIDPSFDITSPTTTPVTNGAATLNIVLSATDATSGAVTAQAKVGDTNFATGAISAAVSGGVATLPVTGLSALAEGTPKVYVRVLDNAGRASVVAAQPVILDKTFPTVTFSSHADAAVINKTVSFSGTSSDANGISTCQVQVYNYSTSTWVSSPSGTMSGTNAWSLSDYDSTTVSDGGAYDSSPTVGLIHLALRAHVTDAAGNVTDVARTLVIDQDSDRPVVKLTNVNVDGTSILKMTNTVFGTVSDDDGVALLEISETGTFSDTASDDIALDGGTWSFDSSSGDGTKRIWFRVTDTKGTVFTTDLANEPKIQYGATVWSSYVDYRVDTVTPELGSTIYADRAAPFDFAGAVALTNNMAFGGSSKQFSVGITATDANGIASVSVTVPGAAASPYATTTTFANAPVISAPSIRKGGSYRIETRTTTDFVSLGAANNNAGTEFTATRDGTAGDGTDTVRAAMYVTGSIDVSSASDGYVQIAVEVTDNSGLKATATRTILIDNTAPTVTHQSPIVGSTVNGEIEVKGLSDDGLGSGVKSVQYKIGYNYAGESWSSVTAGTLSWRIDFKGANKIDIYAVAGEGIEGSGADAGLWTVPILMRVEDNAGNVYESTVSTYTLKVDPSGDKPKVTVTYPDPAETNRVLGGIIRIFGSAEDDDAVASVWMQIDTNNDGLFDANDDDYGAALTDWYNGGDGQPVSGTISWNKSINTAGEFNPAGGTETASEIRSGIRYKILSQGTTDFTSFGAADSNAGTEFTASRDGMAGDGSGTVEALIKRIRFRVRARDTNTTPVDGAWVGPYVIDVDKNVPKIGSSSALSLTQGATVQPYVADMWVKNNWTLGGSVEDESGIADIQITGDITGSLSANPSWFVAEDIGSGKYNYALAIPLNTVAGSTGNIEFTVTAYDNNTPQLSSNATISVNYDNQAPSVTTLVSAGSAITTGNPVVQSNNSYTFESSVTEEGSGFQRVAFFFVRDVATDGTYYEATDRVYNPMVTKDGNANRTYMNLLTPVDGLPRLALTGAARPDEYTLSHASLVNNYNVRKGGLVKIGGLDRLITSVTYASGTIQWANAVSVSVKTADVAYALVVDNLKIESPVWSGDTLVSITNDDGDWLVESVERSGGLYSWTTSIDSRNIPDGPIEIHWVAYDKAGNYTTGTVNTSVQNNRPMLAAVTLGTDLDGNGTVSQAERVAAYSALDGSGSKQAVATVDSAAFIAKDLTSVDIDVVGGNGKLQYVFTNGAATIHSLSTLRTGTEISPAVDTGTDTLTSTAHGYTDGRLVYLDATVLPTETGSVTLARGNYYVRDATANTFRLAKTYGGAAIDFVTAGSGLRFMLLDTILVSRAQLEDATIGEGAHSFVFTIWDSTEETTPGTDSQWAKLTVPLIVDAVDTVTPKSVISPFFWTNATTNSLYGGSKANGHIEITGVAAYGTDPDVSGQISIRGTAYDDQRLSAIWMYIGNGTDDTNRFAFTGASTDNAFDTDGNGTAETLGRTYALVATYSSATGLWTGSDQWAANGWKFTVTPDYLDQSGHKVDWQLDWDSSKISGVASLDRVIRIIAEDKRTAPNASSETANPTAEIATNNVPSYQVDVVPYITGITRTVNTNRSRLGKYPLRNSETDVSIAGFNILMPTTQDANNWVRVYSAASGGNFDADLLTVEAAPVPTSSLFQVTMNADTNSGWLRLAVNGIEAINNVNNDAAEYNKEISAANAAFTAEWNDNRYLMLFRTGDSFRESSDPEYVSMSFDAVGNRLVGQWSNSGYASTYYGTPVADGDTREQVFTTYDPPTYTDVFVDADAEIHSLYLDDSTNGGGTWGYLRTEIDNGLIGYIEILGDDDESTPNSADGMDEKLHQFRNGRMAVRSATNDQYISYYDYFAKCLKYARVINGAETFVGNAHRTDSATVVDGADYFVNNPVPTLDVGMWSDIQIDDIGTGDTATWRPVIVYYDNTNEKLKLARGNSSQPSGTAGWTIQDVTGGAYMGSGSLSMKIDSTGALHIVTRNGMEGGLYYIHAANINGTGTYTFDAPVLVDGQTVDGSWADITLNGTSPMISYKNGTSYNGLKYAYVASGTGLSASDWEYLIVPAATAVADQRTNIEYTAAAADFPYDGNVAFGYAASNFQIVYLRRQLP